MILHVFHEDPVDVDDIDERDLLTHASAWEADVMGDEWLRRTVAHEAAMLEAAAKTNTLTGPFVMITVKRLRAALEQANDE